MFRKWMYLFLSFAALAVAGLSYRHLHRHRPRVVRVSPEHSADKVNEYTRITARLITLPNGAIDSTTISPATVYLTEVATGAVVAAHVGCDAEATGIQLLPQTPLKLNTTYRLEITNGVKDREGFPFMPYVATFTTAAVRSDELARVQFARQLLPNTEGRHSTLSFGPDGRLWALSIDGLIRRFPVAADGSLGKPEELYSLQDISGKRQPRLAIGMCFDPASTAENPIVWVTHSSFVFDNGPDWDGRLSRLSGPQLRQVQDVVVHLPRSAKDHLSNSVAFGPDGCLYLAQGSTTAMGAPDATWGHREEHLLSGALLRLDPRLLGRLPLDVRTPDAGGQYNPFAPGAPLTIYATGLRNAYDLLWHSNGALYVPTNGSASGGNVPGAKVGQRSWDGRVYGGPAAPPLEAVKQTQKDFLFRLEKGGYYGHPNPVRGEYIMNGGNPTGADDAAEVTAYPVGTRPDRNWRGYAFDFHNHKSPNGIIEYKGRAFGNALRGKLIVALYTTGELVVLKPDGAAKDIVSVTGGSSLPGFSGFSLPLDLTEDPRTGNIYVSEYGTGGISLLRPQATAAVVGTGGPGNTLLRR